MRTLLNSYTLDIPRKLPIIGVEPLFRRDEKRPAPGTPMWHQRPHSTWGCCWRLARRAEREERLPESHRLRARYPGTGGPHRGQLRLALGGGLLHRSPAGHQLQEQLGAAGSGPAPGRGRSHPGVTSNRSSASPASMHEVHKPWEDSGRRENPEFLSFHYCDGQPAPGRRPAATRMATQITGIRRDLAKRGRSAIVHPL